MNRLVSASWFRAVLLLASLVFVALSARELAARWDGAGVRLRLLPAAGAFALLVPSMVLMGLAWSALARALLPRAPPLARALSVYASSTVGKYLPGKVGQLVLRVSGLTDHGATAVNIGASMVIEVASWAATGAVVALALLGFGAARGAYDLLGALAWLTCGGLLLLCVLLATLDRARYPAFVRNRLGLGGAGPLLPWTMPVLHLCSWALWALSASCVCLSVGVPSGGVYHASAFFVLAPIAGFLALPLPAGAGVRESMVVLGVTPLAGAQAALAAALLARATSLVADLLLWVILSWGWPRARASARSDLEP